MTTADSIARLDLIALGCLIGAGVIAAGGVALVIAGGLLSRLRRKDRT